MKMLLLIMPAMMLVSCESALSTGPDMTPIENGLRFLGVALVVGVLVSVLGNLRKGGS